MARYHEGYLVPDPDELESLFQKMITVDDHNTISFSTSGKEIGIIPFLVELAGPISRTPSHDHNYLEVVLIIDGTATHTVGGVDFRLTAGDVYFLDNDLAHEFCLGSNETLRYVNIAFLPEILNRSITLDRIDDGFRYFLLDPFFRFEGGAKALLHLTASSLQRLSALALLIVDSFQRSGGERDETVDHLFKAFAYLIAQEYRGQVSVSRSPEGQRRRDQQRREIWEEVVRLIHGLGPARVSVQTLSKTLGLGYTKLSRLFRDLQGVTLVEYITRRRVEAACELLTQSDAPITEIAYSAGFNDISHFNHCFKRFQGQTPGDYRRQHDK